MKSSDIINVPDSFDNQHIILNNDLNIEDGNNQNFNFNLNNIDKNNFYVSFGKPPTGAEAEYYGNTLITILMI